MATTSTNNNNNNNNNIEQPKMISPLPKIQLNEINTNSGRSSKRFSVPIWTPRSIAALTPRKLANAHGLKIQTIMDKEENKICADCNALNPSWASVNIGCFVCTQCSGVHRSLGTHISFVMSCTLDNWSPEQIWNMAQKGNEEVNAEYEFFVPSTQLKPRSNEIRSFRQQYIEDKYKFKKFTKSNAPLSSTNQPMRMPPQYVNDGEETNTTTTAANTSLSGMNLYSGMLTIVVKGVEGLKKKGILKKKVYSKFKVDKQKVRTMSCQTNISQNYLSAYWNETALVNWKIGGNEEEILCVGVWEKGDLKNDCIGETLINLKNFPSNVPITLNVPLKGKHKTKLKTNLFSWSLFLDQNVVVETNNGDGVGNNNGVGGGNGIFGSVSGVGDGNSVGTGGAGNGSAGTVGVGIDSAGNGSGNSVGNGSSGTVGVGTVGVGIDNGNGDGNGVGVGNVAIGTGAGNGNGNGSAGNGNGIGNVAIGAGNGSVGNGNGNGGAGSAGNGSVGTVGVGIDNGDHIESLKSPNTKPTTTPEQQAETPLTTTDITTTTTTTETVLSVPTIETSPPAISDAKFRNSTGSYQDPRKTKGWNNRISQGSNEITNNQRDRNISQASGTSSDDNTSYNKKGKIKSDKITTRRGNLILIITFVHLKV